MIPSEFGSAAINHLWQSTVVVGVAWVLALALRKNHARVRYWVWFVASMKFLAPFSVLMAAGEWVRRLVPAAPVARPAVAIAMEQVTEPFAGGHFFEVGTAPASVQHSHWWPWLLLAVWICGALIVAVRFGRGWWGVWAAKRAARQVGLVRAGQWFERNHPSGSKALQLFGSFYGTTEVMPRQNRDPLQPRLRFVAEVPVLVTPAKIEPGIFGIFRPVLLLPEGILERLTPEELRAIVAHEMCHVRRRDNLTFAIHMIVEALFWFYPPVWWIGARLIDERERACDEAVVQAGGKPEVYAEGILTVCKFFAESPLACVSGVTGADLKKRIVRIMAGHTTRSLTSSGKLLLGAAALAGMAMPVMFGLIRAAQLHAQTQQEDVVSALPRFEVASVKPSRPDDQENNWRGSATGVSIENYTLRHLIRVAYGLKEDSQVVGGPKWLDQKAFDISAKFDDAEVAKVRNMSGPERFAEISLMVRALLAQRFQLKVTREVKDRPIFALVQASSGAKLTASAPESDENGKPHVRGNFLVHSRDGHMTATHLSMDGLADFLTGGPGDRLVVNRTGLTGEYDLKLDWAEDRGNGVPSESPYPGLFEALQEQLGLKLEPQKGPVNVLVIERVEQPSAN
jgi:bla regulator protein blaR1